MILSQINLIALLISVERYKHEAIKCGIESCNEPSVHGYVFSSSDVQYLREEVLTACHVRSNELTGAYFQS